MAINDMITTRELITDVLRTTIQRRISQEEIHLMNISTTAWIDDIAQQIAIEVRIAALKAGTGSFTIEVPTEPQTFWQAIKFYLFPEWLQRRFPVKHNYALVPTEHYNTCPHLLADKQQAHILFLAGEDDDIYTLDKDKDEDEDKDKDKDKDKDE